MKTLTYALALTSTLAFGGIASAQDAPLDPDAVFDFGDELVHGDLVAPDGDNVFAIRGGRRVSLIRPRSHYVPELMKSVETL